MTLYRDDAVFQALRAPEAFHGRCGICGYRAMCGGSRARAFAMTNDPMESDPLCPYQPNGRELVA